MFYKGVRDYLDLGTWDVMCAYCGRKRKATELVRDREFAYGLWACPEHADFKHPQDFARGVKDDMSVPFAQPPVVSFVELDVDFPLTITPEELTLTLAKYGIATGTGLVLITGSGEELVTQVAYGGEAIAMLPDWVVPVSFAWSWASGGTGITINNANTNAAQFVTSALGNSGVAQCLVVDNLGGQATATMAVSS